MSQIFSISSPNAYRIPVSSGADCSSRRTSVYFLQPKSRRTFPTRELLKYGRRSGKNITSSFNTAKDFHTLVRYLNQFPPGEFLPAMSNFHCLVFLATSNILPLKDHLGDLCTAIRNKNVELARRLSKSEQRCTVIQLMQAAKAPSPEPQGSGEVDMFDMSHSPSGAGWSCKHCTLMNQHRHENCDMCGLPQH
ncbi:nuclear protein localization protein 4 homolog [Pocillopora damicornis]|uniref:nuclear protein localization protein 4 homolog n=1 Tax=Pocillopora damicornis TaxID=46731 RepID=UPI000F550263|nr:nuclear protein localization protein 4 homolog [Pocillopora damicornis]